MVCAGVSHRHLSDHLSELVENTINDLEQSKVGRGGLEWGERGVIGMMGWIGVVQNFIHSS